MKKIKIQVTSDKKILTRAWCKEYAEEHFGKTYEAVLDNDGWAVISGAKFPPECFSSL